MLPCLCCAGAADILLHSCTCDARRQPALGDAVRSPHESSHFAAGYHKMAPKNRLTCVALGPGARAGRRPAWRPARGLAEHCSRVPAQRPLLNTAGRPASTRLAPAAGAARVQRRSQGWRQTRSWQRGTACASCSSCSAWRGRRRAGALCMRAATGIARRGAMTASGPAARSPPAGRRAARPPGQATLMRLARPAQRAARWRTSCAARPRCSRGRAPGTLPRLRHWRALSLRLACHLARRTRRRA